LKLISIVAQGGTPAPSTTQQVNPPGWVQWMPLILLGIIFYLFMFRPNKGKDQKRNQMLATLKKGDEVQTIGGEFGRVVDTRDDRVLLKVDETSNTKIWYSKNSIHRVVIDDKAEVK
jgi:preprotein translocase subunit YajC